MCQTNFYKLSYRVFFALFTTRLLVSIVYKKFILVHFVNLVYIRLSKFACFILTTTLYHIIFKLSSKIHKVFKIILY